MKINDLVLSQFPNRDKFLKACLPIEEWQANHEEGRAILEKAQTSEQLINMILSSDTMRGTQIYAELSKDQPDHADRIMRDVTGWILTTSDAGGLKIGNGCFSVIVPNGIGDGDMHFAVVGKGCFNADMLSFWTTVEGSFDIYDHDCGPDVIGSLEGRYGIYYGYGLVIFEEWGK